MSILIGGKRKIARNAANAAAMTAFPTTPPPAAGDATCASLADFHRGGSAPRSAKVSIRAAGNASLTDAFFVGWNAAASIWEACGDVRDGKAVTLTATRGYGQLLRDIAGAYSHFSVVGTLSASTVTVEIEPIEGVE